MFHLLRQPHDQSRRLAESLVALVDRVRTCERCRNLTESPLCDLCADPRRDGQLICVVEEASDIASIERAGEFRGLYHVLRWAPLPAGWRRSGRSFHRRAPGADGP